VAHPSVLDAPQTAAIFHRIWPVRLQAALEYFERKLGRKAGPDNLDRDTLYWLDRARGVSAADYLSALEDMDAFTHSFAAWWAGGFDILVSPTTGTVTPKLGALGMDAARIKTSALWWPFTAFFNMAGQPAISLPLHWTSSEAEEAGLPVGVQLGAAYAREDLLIRLAAQLEQARPWSGRIPPVHA
jgi:amidase